METVSFVSEVQSMMHACGDARRPLRESATLVESTARQAVCHLCAEAAKLSRGEDLMEAVLFLMRRDKEGVRHVLRTISYKKLARQVQRALSEEDPLFPASSGPVPGHRASLNLSFLDPIGADPRLDFHSLFEGGDGMDSVTRQRYERYESLTRCMDTAQYLEFTECRAVNFTRRPGKFREWVGVSEEAGNPRLLELLGYLCYEAVRRIVELALECREQQQGISRIFDPLSSLPSHLQPPASGQETARPLKRPGPPTDSSFPPLVSTSPLSSLRHPSKRPRLSSHSFHPLHPPLLPAHLREATRRLCQQTTQFQLFSGPRSATPLKRTSALLF